MNVKSLIKFLFLTLFGLFFFLACGGGGGGGDGGHNITSSETSSITTSAATTSSETTTTVFSTTTSSISSTSSSTSTSTTSTGTTTTSSTTTTIETSDVPWDTFFYTDNQHIAANSTSQYCYFRGINLPGLEYGHFGDKDENGQVVPYPGTKDIQYWLPKEEYIENVKKWGFNIIRLPFEWARLVTGYKKEGDPINLDQDYLNLIDEVISWAGKNKVYLIIEMHDFLKYWDDKDSQKCVCDELLYQNLLASTWKKIAQYYNSNKVIIGFEIMNEPVRKAGIETCNDTNWHDVAQKTINSIREVDSNHLIFIDGKNYSHSFLWQKENGNTVFVKDTISPSKIVFSPHIYYDENMDSSYDEGSAPKKYWEYYVRDRIVPALDWAKNNKIPIFFTESGIPNSKEWGDVIDYIFKNYFDPLRISHCYWFYEPEHNKSNLGISKPEDESYQLKILTKHLGCTYTNTENCLEIDFSFIYDDSIIREWKDASWGEFERNFSSPDVVYSGTNSISVKFDQGTYYGIKFYHEYIDAIRYNYLQFYIHGGLTGGQNFWIFTEDIEGTESGKKNLNDYIIPSGSKWEQVQIPLKDLVKSSDTVITSVIFQNDGNKNDLFYIDEIKLIK